MIALFVAALILVLDRLTKAWAIAHLAVGTPVPFVGSLVEWNLIRNHGAAFGMLSGQSVLFVAVAIAAVFGLLYALRRRPKIWIQIGIGGILGGALGNLWDRLLGHGVVDFIDVRLWSYIFNVADIGITLGAIVLIVALWHES
ncbi:MAG: signal peptidase II [Thermaerobacter sp.]|nr:signal peptidase II [Thermaerobacter sp.]